MTTNRTFPTAAWFGGPKLLEGGVDDDPHLEIRNGLIVLGGFAAIFAVWSASAPLDAAATANGQISVSGHSQVIAHREGGVVSSVDVVEGQHVSAGQVLMELAPEDVGAQVSGLSAEVISLQAQRARLTAELQNLPGIVWPTAFASLTGADLAAAKDAEAIQQAQFEAGLGALRTAQAIDTHKAAALDEQIAGTQGQLTSNQTQTTLLDQQLTGTRSLAEKGYASLNSVRALERSSADLSGAHDQLAANIADYHEQILQAQLESANLDKQRRENAANSLRDTDDQLNTLTPKLDAARLQLARGTLTAQSDGVVTGLSVFSPGAVVAPGQKLMEVVPSHPVLVVDAQIAASDIEGVHVGQRAEVRFISPSTRGAPILAGNLTRLSADSFTDEKTGRSYYTVEVTVPKSQLDLVDLANGGQSTVRPGAPVEVMIPLHKRSAFDYLFEPLSQALWKSFRQR